MQYIFILLLFLLPLPSDAQNFHLVNISSGTGFFVNRGFLITNAHVVKGCKNVTLKGAVSPHDGRVIAIDAERDLAVIQTDAVPPEIAPLRYNIDDLKPGDSVLVVGYPGEAGARGEYRVAKATIEDIRIEDNSRKWVYITDVLEHGNSGGPVFDMSGNVIGVVVAKVEIQKNDNTPPIQVGAMISLNTLKEFLLNNGIFSEGGGYGVEYASSYIEERATHYIVNVQCQLNE